MTKKLYKLMNWADVEGIVYAGRMIRTDCSVLM